VWCESQTQIAEQSQATNGEYRTSILEHPEVMFFPLLNHNTSSAQLPQLSVNCMRAL
jgi:hypothetical protein